MGKVKILNLTKETSESGKTEKTKDLKARFSIHSPSFIDTFDSESSDFYYIKETANFQNQISPQSEKSYKFFSSKRSCSLGSYESPSKTHFLQQKLEDFDKYKTELCKNWVEKGYCDYNHKCQFAHGKEELMEKQLKNKELYKSKKCKSFYSQGYCLYGIRCLFRHDEREAKDILKKAPNLIEFDVMEDLFCHKRLPFFEKFDNGEQLECIIEYEEVDELVLEKEIEDFQRNIEIFSKNEMKL